MSKILKILLTLAVAALFIFFILFNQSSDKVVFLDIGQGDATLLQNGSQQVLVDGGEGTVVLSKLAEEMPWFDRRIEVVAVTHPQQDHMEGLLHVLDRYEVGLILLPKLSAPTQLQETWLNNIMRSGIPYRFAWQGQTLNIGDIKLSILGPTDSAEYLSAAKSNLNNGSIVARADFHDLSFLLTGDAERPAENLLIKNNAPQVLDTDVLKVGHHGSKTSTSSEFLAAVSPNTAVISAGAGNRYGHPTQLILNRLKSIPVLRTDQAGSVRFLYWRGQWLIFCKSAQLFFSEKSCIKSEREEA